MSSSVQEYSKYLYLLRTHQRRFVIISLAIMTVVTFFSYLMPRKYEANTVVFIEKSIITELVKGIASTVTLDDSIKVLTYALNSRGLMLRVINDLDINLKNRSDGDIEKMISDYKKSTTISVKDRDLFTISFKHADPKFARDYVNSLVRSYIAENVSLKRDQSLDASHFLVDQIGNFRQKVDKAESAVIEYKQKSGGVFNFDESAILQEIHSAQQKLYDLQMKRKVVEGQMNYSKAGTSPQMVKLSALQKRLDELRVMYTENYPEVQATKTQIEALKQDIKMRPAKAEGSSLDPDEMARLETELKALKEGELQLNRFIATNQALLSNVPTSKANLEKLESEKESQKQMYNTLFSRQSQSEVAKEMQLQDRTSTFRIVDPAVTPIRPTSPNRVRIMMMGILGGVVAGAVLLLLLDTFDQTVKYISDLDEFQLPVLAVIPIHRSPLQIQAAAASLFRFYLASGTYFMLLMGFLLMEFMQMTVMDRVLNGIGLPAMVQKLFI